MKKETEKIEQIDFSKLSRSELEDEFIKLYERCTVAEARAEHFYLWVTTTAEYQKEHPIVIYNYRPGRSDEDAREVLGTFKGYVMCDGYTCYNSVLNRNKKTGAPPLPIKPVACMVHVKREFVDALKGLPKKDWEKPEHIWRLKNLKKSSTSTMK